LIKKYENVRAIVNKWKKSNLIDGRINFDKIYLAFCKSNFIHAQKGLSESASLSLLPPQCFVKNFQFLDYTKAELTNLNPPWH